jgi:hypothetical protein
MTTLNSAVTVNNHAEILALARAAVEAAMANRDRCAAAWRRRDPVVEFDPGMVSGIRRRTTASQAKREKAGQDKDFDTFAALRAAEARLASAQARLGVLIRATPVPFTDDELRAATEVRDAHSWYRVVKVNRVTVMVEAGFPWPHPLRRDHVLEVRRLGAS